MSETEADTGKLTVLGRQDLTKSAESVKGELPKYWEKPYIHEHIQSMENPQHRMMAVFLWMSGVRITEAISLQKKDIDFQNYVMTVRWLKSRKYGHRIVPLHPHLRDLLQVFTAAMKAEERLFPISRQRAWQLIEAHFKGNPHMFRHSFAVNWLRCGGSINTLCQVLGHSDIRTTMVYLQLAPIDQGKELMKIEF